MGKTGGRHEIDWLTYTRTAAFTPPPTLSETILFLQESRDAFTPLDGKAPSLMTICIVERQRDEKRKRRRSTLRPCRGMPIASRTALDCREDESGIDSSPIRVPIGPSSSTPVAIETQQDGKTPPSFRYIVQSPSTESTATSHK